MIEESYEDPHCFSNPDNVLVTSIFLNVEVDFDLQILKGLVELSVKRKVLDSSLILDTRDLIIHSVKNTSDHDAELVYALDEPTELRGSKLEIKFPNSFKTKQCVIRIEYETSPKSPSLSWLKPIQTSGKKKPFVFSQNQAIHARSMLPCQDTPAVKTPYSAMITVPRDLTALMSAVGDGEEPSENQMLKTYKFIQKIPIPSYLIAIVVGALESRRIGPRSHVWAEKEIVDFAAEEFSETEKFLATAESICGEYIWGVYDLLVLPPFFAYGGMENPCLTFVSPTLLAGDKSQSCVIAHEIAHSWTGNLVTNKNFEHFWLNEGFTMFLERKILGLVFGEKFRHLHALNGWNDLSYTINSFGEKHNLTKLCPVLKDVDADESCNFIPYEKGHAFLCYLETILGGPDIFENFLKSYIEQYKYKSIDTTTWKYYLLTYFHNKLDILSEVDWDAWLHGTGFPPVKPKYDTSLVDKCNDLCQLWVKADETNLNCFSENDICDFHSVQVVQFLSFLLEKEPLGIKKLEKMDELYQLNEKSNCEIKFRYIQLGLRSHWKDIIPKAVKFVSEVGRAKLIDPVYKELYNWDETRDVAISTFKENEEKYMHSAVHAIRQSLKL